VRVGNGFQPLESVDINFESRHEEILMNSILIVDDDERQRKQIYWALKDYYELFEAVNRLETLQIVNEHPVDLVLL